VVRRSRSSGAAMRLVLLILITVGVVVTVTAAFLMLWSGGPNDVRVADQTGESSSNRASIGDNSTQETVGAESETRKPEAKGGAGDDFRFATELHENKAAGYSFRYPGHWELETQRRISILTSPNRRIVISFGLGPKGRVSDAYDEFVALVDETYTDVDIEMVDATHVADNVAVLARGAATTTAGIRVRFLVTVIERRENQRAIGALAATNVGSAKFPRAVREVLASFRPI
jgi:hypothetical protein